MCLSAMINLSNDVPDLSNTRVEKNEHRMFFLTEIESLRVSLAENRDFQIHKISWEKFPTIMIFSTIFRLQKNSRPGNKTENVGLVRFELTIDGSLRHASVLQRVIINHQEQVPMFFPKISERSIQQTHGSSSAAHERKDRWSPSPFRARPQPPGHAGKKFTGS